MARRLKKSFMRILPLARKLVTLSRCILSQILNFQDYFFFGGGPRPPWGVLASLGQSLARVKI